MDLRGADLRGADLHGLPLARIIGGLDAVGKHVAAENRQAAAVHLDGAFLTGAHLDGTVMGDANLTGTKLAGAHLESADLMGAHLEGAVLEDAHLERSALWAAHLEGADLWDAHLEGAHLGGAQLGGANLQGAHLEGTDLQEAHLYGMEVAPDDLARLRKWVPDFPSILRGAVLNEAFFDSASSLRYAWFGDGRHAAVQLADARWGDVNLAVVPWTWVPLLGDEQAAWDWQLAAHIAAAWKSFPRQEAQAQHRGLHWDAFDRAVRANRQLATVLRDQGLNEQADRFAYRAQVLQRRVLRLQRKRFRAGFSWFLDRIAGYGYRPERSLIAYLVAVVGFAVAYFVLGRTVGPHLSPQGAFVFSMTSFHGRGFLPGGIGLDDPITMLAAFEAFTGLAIEVSFIATFTQRFFSR